MMLLREYIRASLPLLLEDKRGRITKMGFPREFADMLHEFHPPWSHKYSDWVAQEMLKTDRLSAALNAPSEPRKREEAHLAIIETEKYYTGYVRKGDNLHIWNNGRKKIEPLNDWIKKIWNDKFKPKFEIIFQWMDSKGGGPKLSKMTLDQAYEKAWLLPELMKSEEEGEIMLQLGGGYRWVNLKTSYCKAEATAMGHCANDDSGELWTLRDKKGYPHVTCTVSDEGVVVQMKGRNNSVPKAEYHPHIVALLSMEDIKGIKTEEDYDFHWNNLSENDQQKVMDANPDFETEASGSSTVDLLRDGDIARIEAAGIFSDDTILQGGSAIFTVFTSKIADLYSADDDHGSWNAANNVLHGRPWEDSDWLRETWDEQEKERIEDLLDDANQDIIFDLIRKENPNWAMEYFEDPESYPTPEDAWDDMDFETIVNEDSILAESGIMDMLADAWVETKSEVLNKSAIEVFLSLPAANQTVRTHHQYRASSTTTRYALVDSITPAENNRVKMELSFDRLADYIDMHHPGTPMNGHDIINMIMEISSEMGMALVKIDDNVREEIHGDNEEEFNASVHESLTQLQARIK
jgi:hypothetical protein